MSLPILDKIKVYFPDQKKSSVKNLLIMCASIFEAESTNLNKVKRKIGKITGNLQSSPAANYRRSTRFFNLPDEEKRALMRILVFLIVFLIKDKEKIKYLTLDGTSWEIGDKKVQLLTLCIVYKGVSIPLWWEELDKKGHSNTKERKKVIRQASKVLNLKGLILLADREYIGKEWFNYLRNKGIGFIIRLKENTYVDAINEASQRARKGDIFQKARYRKLIKMAQWKRYSNIGVSKYFKMNSKTYTFVVIQNPKQDPKAPLLFFISTLKDKIEIVKTYPIRWSIECCFKHLKSNGFDLEAINLKAPLKIMLMMAIVSFLYVLCVVEGFKQLKTKKKSHYKEYKDGTKTLAVSVFVKGLDALNNMFSNLSSFLDFLIQLGMPKKLTISQNVQ